MNLSRRTFFQGLLAAPAIVKIPGLLMPIKPFPYITLDEYFERILKPTVERMFDEALFDGMTVTHIELDGLIPTFTSIPHKTWRILNSGDT